MNNQTQITTSFAAHLAAIAGLTPDSVCGFKRNGLAVDTNGIYWFMAGAYGMDFTDEKFDCNLILQAGRVLGRLRELEVERHKLLALLRPMDAAERSLLDPVKSCHLGMMQARLASQDKY